VGKKLTMLVRYKNNNCFYIFEVGGFKGCKLCEIAAKCFVPFMAQIYIKSFWQFLEVESAGNINMLYIQLL
jgi:hypothetical protein